MLRNRGIRKIGIHIYGVVILVSIAAERGYAGDMGAVSS